MSSAEAGLACVALNRRALARGLLLLVAAAPVLAACGDGGGLRPLYGPTMSGAGLQDRLSQVDIAPIPGRVGQRIRNELVFHNTGGGPGSAAAPTHRLEVTIRESVQSTLVKIDGEALGQIYAIEANFRLISMKDKKVVLQGASHGRAAFERFQSIYSNVRAREDAENRVARTVSDDLKVRLATYLSGAA
jgi:LPS-assembly lipoprotein